MEPLSKAAQQRYLSNILKTYPINTVLTGQDKNMLLVLLQKHPKAKDKIGCGIKDIRVAGEKWSKRFEIIRTDGSTTDISYRKCLYGEKKQIDIFRDACRTAVVPDILAFRDRVLATNPICRYRNIPLNRDNCIVDHVKPKVFNVIVGNFISANQLNIDEVEIGGDVKREFVDKSLNINFREFHRKHAALELVYYEANNKECR